MKSCEHCITTAGAASAALVQWPVVKVDGWGRSWLDRIGQLSFFLSPPDFERPGSCESRTLSTQAWRVFPPPRLRPSTSPEMIPTRSHACRQAIAVVKCLVKISLH